MEAGQTTHLGELLKTAEHRVLSLARSERSLGLVGLLTARGGFDLEFFSLASERLQREKAGSKLWRGGRVKRVLELTASFFSATTSCFSRFFFSWTRASRAST